MNSNRILKVLEIVFLVVFTTVCLGIFFSGCYVRHAYNQLHSHATH